MKQRGLVIAALFAAAALLSQPAQAQRVLRFGHVYETAHPMHAASVAAAEHMGRCTNNAVRVDVFPASQLGSENALNEQIRFGGVDIILTGQLFASTAFPALAVGGTTYIFRDRAHALAYRTSDVFRELMEGYSRATSQHMLAAGYFGAFNVSSNRPFRNPEEMRGLRVRVPNTPAFMAFPRAAGANPTPIAFAEVYVALQQGVVEASINPLPVTFAFRYYEVQRYVVLTGHLMEFAILIYSDNAWRALNAQQQTCAREMANLYGEHSTRAIVQQEDNLRQEMTQRNLIQFVDPDREAFQRATASVVEELVRSGQFTQALVDRVRAVR